MRALLSLLCIAGSSLATAQSPLVPAPRAVTPSVDRIGVRRIVGDAVFAPQVEVLRALLEVAAVLRRPSGP